jgi:hypothetical protein
MAFVLASVVVGGALQAGPAFAGATSSMSEGTLEFAGQQLEDAAVGSASMFSTLPASYSPEAFTEEERELVCPRQYRVRETIYVGQ